ncbi:MAG: ATP-binding protein [Candidatus Thorarchaeota archaeon]
MLDPITLFALIVPILIVFGLSILTMTVIHLGLSVSGNRFATEITCSIGMIVFFGVEIVLGIASLELTLSMLLLVTPVMLIEVFRPSNEQRSGFPQIITIEEDASSLSKEVLCLSYNGIYVALTGVRIKGIPLPNRIRDSSSEGNEELKWLYPLWEDGKKSGSIYTLEAKFEKGLTELRFFTINQDKDFKQAMEKAYLSRQLAETWLTRIKYDYEVITSDDLQTIYHELDFGRLRATPVKTIAQSDDSFLGGISIEHLPDNLTNNWGEMLQQFLRNRLSGHTLLSFVSGPIPKLHDRIGESRDDPKVQTRTPFRVEDHKHRKTYRQMAEVVACEETGAFRIGTSVFLRGSTVEEVDNAVKNAEAIIQGVWGGVKITNLSGNSFRRDWSKFLLRNYIGKSVSVSGARLTGLVQISEAMPGIPNCVVPPSFTIPIICDSENSVVFGSVLDRRKVTAQEYSIPINTFCLHTGIYGNPGSGKTNTGMELTHQIYQHGIPFLAIVPAKTEWRMLSAFIPELRIFTAGDETTSSFRYNFFDVPPGVPTQTHINNITLCFIANWPTEGILTEHITKIFRRVYTNAGWNLLTNKRGAPILLGDLYSTMEEVANELKYGDRLKQDFVGALTARFESLLDDPVFSVMVNTREGLTIPELLNNPTILELRHLPDTQRALLTSLIMVAVAEYLEVQGSSAAQELHHLLVLEEAHHVLKRVGNGYGLHEGHSSQQQAINTIVQLLREARGLGLGVVLIDQLPADLADAAVKLPGITIIHGLKDARERLLVGGQANLNDEQLLHIGALKCGEAVIHQAFSGPAVLTQIVKFQREHSSEPWTDIRIANMMTPFFIKNPHLRCLNLPVMKRWEADPVVFDDLMFLTESPGFRKAYAECLVKGQEYADEYVLGLVQKFVPDPTESVHYCNRLVDHLGEVGGTG